MELLGATLGNQSDIQDTVATACYSEMQDFITLFQVHVWVHLMSAKTAST